MKDGEVEFYVLKRNNQRWPQVHGQIKFDIQLEMDKYVWNWKMSSDLEVQNPRNLLVFAEAIKFLGKYPPRCWEAIITQGIIQREKRSI